MLVCHCGKLDARVERWNPRITFLGLLQAMPDSNKAVPRILVVEDEYLIRMLLEDMLVDLGYEVAAAVGTVAEASEAAANGLFDAAILDVNVGGKEIGRAHV